MESVKAPLKINYTIECWVKQNTPDEFWVVFETQPWMSINLGGIPWQAREHIMPNSLLVMTLDMEPRNAQPQ